MEMWQKKPFLRGTRKVQLENIFNVYQDGYMKKLKIPYTDAAFADLLNGLLAYDAESRLSAHDALEHSYFRNQ